ncbi:MAG: TrmH family RNA methyltransferase [Caldicoprobacterales bacterium]|jgi:TrmH family RNA methyltransferase|nr:TrmH family RNA methyltransferase [Clostridiales bacterium]
MIVKPYKKEFDYSYTLGVFPTIELLQNQPGIVKKVILHSSGSQNQGIDRIIELCNQHGISVESNDKLVNRLSKKENCYAVGIFSKLPGFLSGESNHILLVNPSDMGNLGTIIRTAVGFGCTDIGIISPAVDAYNPKVIRGSMGSFFKVNLQYFDSFEEYKGSYHNQIFTFRLNGETTLNEIRKYPDKPYALVFGNESSGLGSEFDNIGIGVRIPHSQEIDSLNLAVAVGIALNHFANLSDTQH